MRTGISVLNNSTSKMDPRIPDGAMFTQNSLYVIPGRLSTCYVIQEEDSGDMEVDDNGNEQNEVRCSTNNKEAEELHRDMKICDNALGNFSMDTNHAHYKSLVSNFLNIDNSVNTNVNNMNKSSVLSSTQEISSQCTKVPDFSQGKRFPVFGFQEFSSNKQETFSDLKKGHLVMILSEQSHRFVHKHFISSCNHQRQCSTRNRVVVQIHGRGYERYAIITHTRRDPAAASYFLKLKHSRVTQSATDPSCFTVVIDGAEGKSFTFEASSPETALEWMKAFSSNCSYLRDGTTHRLLQNEIPQHGKDSVETTEERRIPSQLTNVLYQPHMPALSESLDEEDEE